MSKQIITVRVNDDVEGGWAVSPYRGQTLEVTESSNDNGYYHSDKGFTIHKRHVTVIEGKFEPKSGMTFLDSRGNMGLFVGTDNGLWMMFSDKTEYRTHTQFKAKYLTEAGVFGTSLVRIWKGMNDYGNLGLNSNLNEQSQTEIVWERVKTSADLELNSDYTATVKKDEVVVGCQTIPMDKIREIVKIADGLGKA